MNGQIGYMDMKTEILFQKDIHFWRVVICDDLRFPSFLPK